MTASLHISGVLTNLKVLNNSFRLVILLSSCADKLLAFCALVSTNLHISPLPVVSIGGLISRFASLTTCSMAEPSASDEEQLILPETEWECVSCENDSYSIDIKQETGMQPEAGEVRPHESDTHDSMSSPESISESCVEGTDLNSQKQSIHFLLSVDGHPDKILDEYDLDQLEKENGTITELGPTVLESRMNTATEKRISKEASALSTPEEIKPLSPSVVGCNVSGVCDAYFTTDRHRSTGIPSEGKNLCEGPLISDRPIIDNNNPQNGVGVLAGTSCQSADFSPLTKSRPVNPRVRLSGKQCGKQTLVGGNSHQKADSGLSTTDTAAEKSINSQPSVNQQLPNLAEGNKAITTAIGSMSTIGSSNITHCSRSINNNKRWRRRKRFHLLPSDISSSKNSKPNRHDVNLAKVRWNMVCWDCLI